MQPRGPVPSAYGPMVQQSAQLGTAMQPSVERAGQLAPRPGYRHGPATADHGHRFASDGQARSSRGYTPAAIAPTNPSLHSLPTPATGESGGADSERAPAVSGERPLVLHPRCPRCSSSSFPEWQPALSSIPSPSSPVPTQDPASGRWPWRPEEGSGTAADPLAGECVPCEGERAAVERGSDATARPSLGNFFLHNGGHGDDGAPSGKPRRALFLSLGLGLRFALFFDFFQFLLIRFKIKSFFLAHDRDMVARGWQHVGDHGKRDVGSLFFCSFDSIPK